METGSALVSVTYTTEAKDLCFHQSGIVLAGKHVITAANRIFMAKEPQNMNIKNIQIIFKDSTNNIMKQNATIETIWHSEEVEEALNSSFSSSNTIQGKMSDRSHWSYFVFLKIHLTSKLLRNAIESKHILKESDLEKGQDILISYAPFGSVLLLNSVSGGIISNTFGRNHDIFLTDARLAALSEGAPVYRKCSCRNPLIGMLVFNMPYSVSGTVSLCGFSLCVNIITILKSFNKKFTANLKNNLPAIKPQLVTSTFLDADYIVSINVGVGCGTGVIIACDGLVMTCAHNLNFAHDLEVRVTHQNTVYDAAVLYTSTKESNLDIAFLLIHEKKTFPFCYLTSKPPKKGELVYSFGHGEILNTFTPFVSKGIISQFLGDTFFISSCLVLKGSSGGVIVRPNGEVIGLITALINRNGVSYPHLSNSFHLCQLIEFIEAFKNSRDVKILEMMVHNKSQWKRSKL